MNKFKFPRVGLAAILLAGCSSIPEMTSQDGSTFSLRRSVIIYARPSGPATNCEFGESFELWVCEDGTTSTLVTASLPLSFQGVLFVEFDGKTFTNSALMAE
ncbi:YgdI/YgdR family lipoprotein [Tritonibacter mobilis]|uniref:hypothetical protein n=1 Tax=Tritonibacter mobilis TaxID=379347 RepID=UPI0013A534CD|nr:hypothetical protein [Tritonibacter mobilis]